MHSLERENESKHRRILFNSKDFRKAFHMNCNQKEIIHNYCKKHLHFALRNEFQRFEE